jgi:ASC-1-like (ASCH) protein
VRVVDVRHYKTARELLETEGTKRTLSSGKDVVGGIDSIHSITGYKEAIAKNGVFAIEVEPN